MKTLKVHFATQEDIDAFAKLMEQTVTIDSKSIWYPKRDHEPYSELVTNEP